MPLRSLARFAVKVAGFRAMARQKSAKLVIVNRSRPGWARRPIWP
jgi:hypothetical protein